MISNAKIRINLKEANEQAKKSLTNPQKDWEIRIFKGFLYKYSTRTNSTFSEKSQGTSHKYTLPKINQNEFDTLTPIALIWFLRGSGAVLIHPY